VEPYKKILTVPGALAWLLHSPTLLGREVGGGLPYFSSYIPILFSLSSILLSSLLFPIFFFMLLRRILRCKRDEITEC
jgi:hypothetical protein